MNQLVRINLTNKSLPFGDALHLSPVKNHIFVHLEENPFFLNFVIDSKHHFKCKNFEQSYVNGSLKLCEPNVLYSYFDVKISWSSQHFLDSLDEGIVFQVIQQFFTLK